MNYSESALDSAIACSIETVAAPDFPRAAILSRIAERAVRTPRFSGRRFAAAAALLVCCAGLAYGTPKVLHEMRFHIGGAKFVFLAPHTKSLSGEELRELSTERSFHAKLPAGWPSFMHPAAAWRIGPAQSRFYIVQYVSTVGENADAVVVLQSAHSSSKAGIRLRPASQNAAGKQTSWISGDERITIISKNLSDADLERIRQETK